jgi:phosphoribosylformylglycinamidine synthase subunit PurS
LRHGVSMFTAKIYIQLKESVLDPQGQAVLHALHQMNHPEVSDVRIGKYIELKLNLNSKSEAETKTKAYCESLLANTVIESYRFDILEG